jgi:hypothetical protein
MRFLVALLLMLLPFAAAQEPITPHELGFFFANQYHATSVNCPVFVIERADAPTGPFCMEFSLGSDSVRRTLERFVDEYSDLKWAIPWRNEGRTWGRVLLLDSTPFWFMLLEYSPYRTMIVVDHMVLD